MAEQAKPWTHYRARLARLSHDPDGNAEQIAATRRLMHGARLRQAAQRLAADADAVPLTTAERGELVALIRRHLGGETR